MSYGPYSVFTDTVASGASTSGGIDLKKAWSSISLQVPTMSTAASLSIQNSVDGGSTFYQVYTPQINTSTVGVYPLSIGSGIGTNGGTVILGAPLSYPRVVCSGVVLGGVIFKILCVD